MSRFEQQVALLGLAALLVGAPGVVGGQSLDSIAPNARVRIDLPTADRLRFHRERTQSVIGMLETVRADTLLLVVRPGAMPLRIPRAAVRRVYLSGGRPPRWRAALEGALLPALVAGAISGVAANIHRDPGQPSPGQIAASSAAWAAASGAFFGAWSPKERWHLISRTDSIAKQASPTRD